MIKLVRIDYRLLHGQVIVSWLNSYSIQRIIIINDNAYNDDITRNTLKLSKPNNVKLNIFSIEEALKRKNKISSLKENVALIFGNVSDCYDFVTQFPGIIKEINYGNIPKHEDSVEYDKTIYLTSNDVELTKKLILEDIRIYSQQVPTTKVKELNHIL